MTRLPRWVEVGGFCLAAIAGAVNAVGLLGFKHQAVSHLTGTSSLLGAAVAGDDLLTAGHLLLILLSFVAGAVLSGALIGNAALQLGHRYGVALLIEAALLFAAMHVLTHGSATGHFLASAACGLQNGMASTYSGATIRTTHLSGMFTDIGNMIGWRLRGHPFDRRRAVLYTLLIVGFIAGGTIGALAFAHLQFRALALPACGAIALAVVYWSYRQRRPHAT
nr:YoaK family protein [Solimonas marina]